MTKLEKIEWIDVWFDNAEDSENRIMIIGDSIARGYTPQIKKIVGEKYNLDRISTSRGLDNPDLFDEITHFLKNYKYDKILFNNCLHGWHISDEDYELFYEKMLLLLFKLQPQAKLYIALGTSSSKRGEPLTDDEESNARIESRNAIALKLAKKYSLESVDLYTFSRGIKNLKTPDGTHFTDEGSEKLAEMVIDGLALN